MNLILYENRGEVRCTIQHTTIYRLKNIEIVRNKEIFGYPHDIANNFADLFFMNKERPIGL